MLDGEEIVTNKSEVCTGPWLCFAYHEAKIAAIMKKILGEFVMKFRGF